MFAAVAALAILASAHAQHPDGTIDSAANQFNVTLNYLTQADAERDAGNAEDALILYKEAAEKYVLLAARFPDWQPAVVQFRIAYCNEQIRALRKGQREAGSTNAVPPPASPAQAHAARRGDLHAIKAHAAALLCEGDPQRARTLLLDALRIDPDDSGVRLMLAIAQCQAGSFSDATLILNEIIAEEPTNAVAHMALGAAYLGQGRIEDAGGETAIALTLNDHAPAGHYNMARILMQVSPPDLINAKSHYGRFLDLGGKPDPALQSALESAGSPAPDSFTNTAAMAPTNTPPMPPTNAPAMAPMPQ